MMKKWAPIGFKSFAVWLLIFFGGMTACSKNQVHTVELMPAPEVYTDGTIDPFSKLDEDPTQAPGYDMLYATCRQPDTDGNDYYTNERGLLLRLGRAKTETGPEGFSWEMARRVSLLKNRTDKYPVKLSGVDEIGILNRSVTVFTPTELIPDNPDEAGHRFAERINAGEHYLILKSYLPRDEYLLVCFEKKLSYSFSLLQPLFYQKFHCISHSGVLKCCWHLSDTTKHRIASSGHWI